VSEVTSAFFLISAWTYTYTPSLFDTAFHVDHASSTLKTYLFTISPDTALFSYFLSLCQYNGYKTCRRVEHVICNNREGVTTSANGSDHATTASDMAQ